MTKDLKSLKIVTGFKREGNYVKIDVMWGSPFWLSEQEFEGRYVAEQKEYTQNPCMTVPYIGYLKPRTRNRHPVVDLCDVLRETSASTLDTNHNMLPSDGTVFGSSSWIDLQQKEYLKMKEENMSKKEYLVVSRCGDAPQVEIMTKEELEKALNDDEYALFNIIESVDDLPKMDFFETFPKRTLFIWKGSLCGKKPITQWQIKE
jgi:hypothetical protein